MATLLWPESSQQAVRGALRRELHVLNKQFGASCFRTSWEMVGIAPTAVIWNDVAIFRQLVAKEIQQSQAESVLSTAWKDDLLAATALYTGDFLAGFSLPDAEEFEAWQRFEAERLRRAFTGALANVIQWYRQQGNYSAAIPHALRWLAMDTLHEPAHRALMELYAMAGDATAALRHYDECQRILQQELGVPPAAETTALYDSIRNRHVVPPIEKTDPLPPPPVATAFSPTAPPTAQPRIPLIGRRLEWQQLQNSWSTAQQNGAHCVIIAGEAGIGKTRLAEELLAWAGQHQIAAAQTRSYAAQGELAYAAVSELLRTKPFQRCVQLLDDAALTHLSRLWPDLPQPEPVMDSWQRQQLFAALAQSCCVQTRPLLLFFDDLQWADRETLEWLHYLLTTIRHRAEQTHATHSLILVGTMRTGEVDAQHPVPRLLRTLARDDCLTQIDLAPLNPPAVQELANALAPVPFDSIVLEGLQRQTGGNPLFIVESIRTGLFQPGAEAAPVMPGTALWLTERVPQLPPKVYGVIQARLLQLSPQAQEIAALAAVIGRAFSFDLLSAAATLPEITLATALDELWQRHILREQSPGSYDFDHDRIRDVAYSEIGPARRRLLHRQVVEALESSEADRLDTVSGELAAHCVQAGLIKRALALLHPRGPDGPTAWCL
ncbi:MAG: BTAD domain-containing putative transcriptional regulator [Caldilineaceae bacterium]